MTGGDSSLQEPVSTGKVAHGQGGASMPRSIQMGTTPPNKLCQPPAPLPPLTPPDLLSGVGASHSSDTSVTSRDTVTTPASSSCSPDPMEVIIRDLRPAEERWRVAEPLIGHAHQPHRPPAPRSAPPGLSCSLLMLMLMQGSKQSKPSMPPFRLLLPLDH